MSINRRDFMKLTAASGLLLATDVKPAKAAADKSLPEGAVGFLYDATLCIGCKSCMFNCKSANSDTGGALYSEEGRNVFEWNGPEQIWDAPRDLSSKTLNIIKAYRSGSGENKDAENDGYSFVKRHCMHCVDPGCVSACPVSAMEKDPRTGVVTYDADKCIGCRYCQIGCPFNIPKFEWELAFPEIRKCQMCHHLQAFGGYPACCEFCPTGASLFGPVESLLQEAERRLKLKAGESYEYPLHRIGSEKTVPAKAAGYNGAIYGKDEVGGTQYLLLAGVPFDKLGLPALPSRSYAATSSGIQHTLYKGMIAPLVVFGGLLFAAYKSTGSE
jgi:Fe-S-cluster-containing dehydrogenase component